MTSGLLSSSILTSSLLSWYDQMGRDLPWRIKGDPHPHPYHVWLSEIMLQQTTVATVKPYFEAFLQRWPTLQAFGQASLDDVLHAWQGLGYYARARNMHKCAHRVVQDHGGEFPRTAEGLRILPGIGPYTAAAIAAIAFEERVTPVDGNVARVLSRLYALEDPLPLSLKSITSLAADLCPEKRSGDFAQALMDLGATVCTPRSPRCLLCPWQSFCQGFQKGIAERLPVKLPRAPKPFRHTIAFVIRHADGSVLLSRRQEKGLLGGMIEAPSTPWREKPYTLEEGLSSAPLKCNWSQTTQEVRHVFTHFHFHALVCYGEALDPLPPLEENAFWVQPADFSKMAFPTVMKKILSSRAEIF